MKKDKTLPASEIRAMTLSMVDIFLDDAKQGDTGKQFLYALKTKVNAAVAEYEKHQELWLEDITPKSTELAKVEPSENSTI